MRSEFFKTPAPTWGVVALLSAVALLAVTVLFGWPSDATGQYAPRVALPPDRPADLPAGGAEFTVSLDGKPAPAATAQLTAAAVPVNSEPVSYFEPQSGSVSYFEPTSNPEPQPRSVSHPEPAPHSEPQPSNVTITAVEVLRDEITIQWTALTDASRYLVRWLPKGQPEQEMEATTTLTSHTIGSLQGDTTYVIRVEPILQASTQEIKTLLIGIDYDSDDDGLIEVSSLAQLNAIRWDLDGDGTPVSGPRDGKVATARHAVGITHLHWHDDGSVGSGPRGVAGYKAAFPDALARMGCPATGCKGYELTANLDFDTNGNGRADSGDAYWNGGKGWLPIMEGKLHTREGGSIFARPDRYRNMTTNDQMFGAIFQGNRHTIANLYINDPRLHAAGLFGFVRHGSIRNVGLTAPNPDSKILGADYLGSFAGHLRNAEITGSYSNLDVEGKRSVGFRNSSYGGYDIGGLVGFLLSGGVIQESYATGDVRGISEVGGLVGNTDGGTRIRASYATGDVTAKQAAGGLVGWMHDTFNTDKIIASYSTGDVTASWVSSLGVGGIAGSAHQSHLVASYATGTVVSNPPSTPKAGGLVGNCRDGRSFRNINSYWDTQTTGQSSSCGAGVGYTTAELQAPTGYTGIYANWNVDVNGDGRADDPWDFGTSSQYPVLKYGFLNPGLQRISPVIQQSDQEPPVAQNQVIANSPATGAPTISGAAQVGETLTADTSAIADADGLTGASYAYQWVRDNGKGFMDIAEATGATYVLASADQGSVVTVTVSFTDDAGNAEAVTSAATAAVTARPNNPATGAPTISGAAQVGETLTADTSAIADADGLTGVSYAYQWQADGSAIAGATGGSHTLTASEQGKTVTVTVSFTDDAGNAETLTSAATVAAQWPASCTDNSHKIGGLTADSAAANSVAISWTGIHCPGDYVVRYWQTEDKDSTFTQVTVDRTATSYVATGLASGTKYTFRVLYQDPDGRRPWKAAPPLAATTATP